MSYLGNTPTTQSFISGTDYFNGTGSQTAFTLSRTVNSVNDIQVTVNNVVQQPNDAYTISGTTLTMTSAPSAGTNNVYVRYLSTTTQAITPSQNTVSYSTLNSDNQSKLGVMYKNRIINGDMVIDQRSSGASTTVTTTGYFSCDRWQSGATQSSKYSVQQNAGSVTPPAGFTKYLGATSLSSYSPISNDAFYLLQQIEGYNTADLNWGTANAKTVTLSFWVRSSLTGTFSGCLYNGSANRTYVFTYTISAANTWTQASVTIPGDTTGTWNTGNTQGIGVVFSLGYGSDYVATAGAWNSSFYATVSGATNIVGTNGATFYLTGVQLEVGTQATAFSTAGGSYGAELALCQRYYQVIATGSAKAIGMATYYTSSNFSGVINWGVPMRTDPTFSQVTGSGYYRGQGNAATDDFNSFSVDRASPQMMMWYNVTEVSGTQGTASVVYTVNNASFLAVQAEL